MPQFQLDTAAGEGRHGSGRADGCHCDGDQGPGAGGRKQHQLEWDPGNGPLRLPHAKYGTKPISNSEQSGFPPCPQCTMPRQSKTRKLLIRLRQCVVTKKGLLGSALRPPPRPSLKNRPSPVRTRHTLLWGDHHCSFPFGPGFVCNRMETMALTVWPTPCMHKCGGKMNLTRRKEVMDNHETGKRR